MSNFSRLTKPVVKAIQDKAKTITTFVDRGGGAIVVSLSDFSREGCRIFDLDEDEQNIILTRTYPIVDGLSWMIYVDNDVIDCSSFAVMKIAHLRTIDDSGELLSGFGPKYYDYDCGFAPHMGALCVKIPYVCNVFVAVSGASQEEDLECAFEAVDPIINFFGPDSAVCAPEAPDWLKEP